MKTHEWTNSTVTAEFGECRDLAALIKAIEKDCSGRGEVVCEIRVNGIVLDEDDEVKFAGTDVARIENLSVKVSDVSNLIDDALKALTEYIPEMVRISLLTSEKFRGEEIESAHRSLESITQGSRWLVDMFAQLRRNAIITVKKIPEAEWTQSEAELLKVTRELIKAFETKDYVLLADVLEYDWVTALQRWQSLLQLAATASQPGSYAVGVGVNDGRIGKAPDSLD